MFIQGINYWPIKKAMYWWKDFDLREVEEDFVRLSPLFSVVRIFLNWEDFQPSPEIIHLENLHHLLRVADLAKKYDLLLMPTFFCGHMSGINWMPEWMLTSSDAPHRFKVYSKGCLRNAEIKNFYHEEDLIQAQLYQIRIVCSALRDHPAIYAYDLGNESSNCVIPRDRSAAREWLRLMCEAVHQASHGVPVTLGMHAEDLEEDRQLWPQDAALYCDFLSMHGYPFYLSWVQDPMDLDLVPFLGQLTRYLGQKEVLLQEFGAPTIPLIPPLPAPDYASKLNCPWFTEEEVLHYYQAVMDRLKAEGMKGAMGWCFADYAPERWSQPPLDQNLHERHFGLFRQDGSPKAPTQAFGKHSKTLTSEADQAIQRFAQALEQLNRDVFYLNPKQNLSKLFNEYKTCYGGQ